MGDHWPDGQARAGPSAGRGHTRRLTGRQPRPTFGAVRAARSGEALGALRLALGRHAPRPLGLAGGPGRAAGLRERLQRPEAGLGEVHLRARDELDGRAHVRRVAHPFEAHRTPRVQPRERRAVRPPRELQRRSAERAAPGPRQQQRDLAAAHFEVQRADGVHRELQAIERHGPLTVGPGGRAGRAPLDLGGPVDEQARPARPGQAHLRRRADREVTDAVEAHALAVAVELVHAVRRDEARAALEHLEAHRIQPGDRAPRGPGPRLERDAWYRRRRRGEGRRTGEEREEVAQHGASPTPWIGAPVRSIGDRLRAPAR